MLEALRAAARQDYRARLMARYYLRNVHHGANPRIWGSPALEALDFEVGDDFTLFSTYRTTRVAGVGRIRMGHGCVLNHGAWITCMDAVTFGDRVGIGPEAVVMDNNAHGIEGRSIEPRPITIENGAWIGYRAMILPGVTVREMSIVAAGAIVTRDVPARTAVAGNPAKPVRSLHYPEDVDRAWWGGAQ